MSRGFIGILAVLAMLTGCAEAWTRSSLRLGRVDTKLNHVSMARQGKLFTPLQSTAKMSVALDRSAIPPGGGLLNNVPFMMFMTWAFLRVRRCDVVDTLSEVVDTDMFRLPQIPQEWIDTAKHRLVSAWSTFKYPFVQVLVFVRLVLRVLLSKLAVLRDVTLSGLEYVGINRPETLDLKDWKLCVLDERELVGGDLVRYRFAMANENSVVPLAVGQELLLCNVDSKDRVQKEAFFPVSATTARGYFEVLVRRGAKQRSPFSRSLDSMALGDELAFKGGRYKLNYKGQDDPIHSMSVVASGLGVTSALQILRGVLSDWDSTVEDAEVLWVNECDEDFVCGDEVEALELRHIEKLLVTRIVEDDIYGRDILKNQLVYESLTPYDEGRLAVICAPDYTIASLRTLYQELGYPSENIISIPCTEE